MSGGGELELLPPLANNMKQYLNIFKRILKLNFSLLLIYRSSFIADVFSSLAWGFFQIVWVLLLTSKIKSAFGWTREEMILIVVVYNVILGFFHCFFSRNFDRFSMMVDRGELDTILVKPADSQFLISFWVIGYSSLARALFNLIILFYLLAKMQIAITLINILGFFFLSIFGVILLYSVWFVVSTLIIWFPRLSNLIDLLHNLTGISRFPPEMIYGFKSFVLLFLVPFTLTIAIPTKVLFNKVLSGDIGLLVFLSLLFFWLSRKFWQYALRYYTSASS